MKYPVGPEMDFRTRELIWLFNYRRGYARLEEQPKREPISWSKEMVEAILGG